MPTYCFRAKDGTVHEVSMSIAELEKAGGLNASIVLDGGEKAKRDLAAEHGGFAPRPGIWPMKSEAMGVHPSQVREAAMHAAKLGVPTDFTKDGRPILTSPSHRKKFAEAHGFFDRNGGYNAARKRDDR